MRSGKWLILGLVAVLALATAACGGEEEKKGGGGGQGELSGEVSIDGSSTVAPFAQAAAELFKQESPNVNVTVGSSGTGGGFEKFCAGETDISDASRPIDEKEEVPICEKDGVSYKEVQVANDGIAVATNKGLKIDCMTKAQLKELWGPDSKVKTFSEIDSKFPNEQVSLFGPGTDSGTFDFFTAGINGEEGETRKDYQPSEDDNVLVQGVEGDKGGLGYFGFSYYEQNKEKLNAISVDDGDGCVQPSAETIQNGDYKPLSRPLYMYASEKGLEKPEVKAFMDFTVKNQQKIAEASQIVPLTPEQATKSGEELGS